MTELNRKCVTCEKDLSITNFAKRFRKDGPWYQSNCKLCSVGIKRKQRAERKERVEPATMYIGEKWCRGHKKDEPKKLFGQNKTNADFLDNYCKNWRKAEYRKKHPVADNARDPVADNARDPVADNARDPVADNARDPKIEEVESESDE